MRRGTCAQQAYLHRLTLSEHGELDAIVPVGSAQRFADTLCAGGVPHEFFVYDGAQHNDVRQTDQVMSRIRAWYSAHVF